MNKIDMIRQSMKLPVILKAENGCSYACPVILRKGDEFLLGCMCIRHGDGTARQFVVSRSRDRLRWSKPEPADSLAFQEAGDTWMDEESGFWFLYYEDRGNICVAVGKDGKNWQRFRRDVPAEQKRGVIYEGDYYEAIPRHSYLHRQAVPADRPIFRITDYGAVGDGFILNTQVIQAALDDAAAVGNGIVLIEDGRYCTETLILHGAVTLWIARDAALVASRDPSSMQDALLIVENAKGACITGGGTIDGHGEYYVHLPKELPLLAPMDVTRVPPVLTDKMGYPEDTIRYAYRSRIRYTGDPYEEGKEIVLRPMYTVWLHNSEQIVVENVEIKDALDWSLVVDYCQDVCVRDVIINDNRHVANTDGIDIMGSRHVEILHCFVSSADDGICIKSPREHSHDGFTISRGSEKMRGTEQIRVRDCTIVSVMNGFKIGTETYYDIRDVQVENCRLLLPDIFPGMVSGIAIESCDGAHISDIFLRNIRMEQVVCPVYIQLNRRNKFGYEDEADEKMRRYGGTVENIRIEQVTAWDVELPSLITGYAMQDGDTQVERCVRNIRIDGFEAVYRDNEENLQVLDPVCENAQEYPESNAFGDLPACGFYIRHASGVTVKDYRIVARSCNTRKEILFTSVQDCVAEKRGENAGRTLL